MTQKIILSTLEDEYKICQNNFSIKNELHQHIDYHNVVCVKPWGHEFLIYQNKKIGIWYLKINKNHQTSLHTHFNKDTFIIVLSGCAKIGLIDQTIYLNPMDYLFIPHYKFHSIGSFSDETFIMEIEVYNNSITFTDKNDLLRIDDIYQRKDNSYQKSINVVSNDIDKYGHFYIDQSFERNINNVFFKVVKIDKNKYNIIPKDTNYNILLDGTIFQRMKYLKEGSIIDSFDELSLIEDHALLLTLTNKDYYEDSKIIYSNEHLKCVVSNLRSKEKKIILSSGCFDILHVGHIHNLSEAKSHGDILMVCLSNDEQISKLKGKDRPINNYEDRINLFKTIKYVDYVILYEESDIQNETSLGEIMKIIDPYYWIKGSDYKEEDIIKKHPYLKRIKLIQNRENKSTTNIINKIKS